MLLNNVFKLLGWEKQKPCTPSFIAFNDLLFASFAFFAFICWCIAHDLGKTHEWTDTLSSWWKIASILISSISEISVLE